MFSLVLILKGLDMLNESKYRKIDDSSDRVIYPRVCKPPKGVKVVKRKLDGQSYATDSYLNHCRIYSTAQLRLMLTDKYLTKTKVESVKKVLRERGALAK